MAIDVKSESYSMEGSFKMGCIIDEKECVVNIVFLPQFLQEYLGERGRGG